MSEQHLKLAKFLRGTGRSLIKLAEEIEDDGDFTKNSEELMSKIGSHLLFEAKAYTFRSPHP